MKQNNGMIEIVWSKKVSRSSAEITEFFQRMANRLIMGAIRYGEPTATQCYMSRLAVELQTYKRTGNLENLFNIANYAFLESIAPENKKFHYDDKVDSTTRSKFGGARP